MRCLSIIMSPLMVPVLLVLAATTATAEESGVSALPGCQRSCGGLDIPYPFGIGAGCFRKGFEVACVKNNSGGGEILALATTEQTIPVLQLSVSPFPEARVLLPVAWQCFNSTGDVTGTYTGDVNFNPEGVYRISNTENELFVLGCNTLIYAKGVRWHQGRFSYKYYTGCVAVTNDTNDPKDGACAGLGCCHVDIPPAFTDTTMSMSSWSHANQEFCPCDYAFIVEKGSYSFKASDLLSTHIPNNQSMPLRVDWTMPLRLDWAIRDNGSATSMSCAQAPSKTTDHEYACRSDHSECIDSTNGPGYFCNCTQGYEGNPYVGGGCTNINECQFPKRYQCPTGSKCIDTDGAYTCPCNLFHRGKDCRPIISMTVVALLATIVAIVLACFAIILLQRRNQKILFNKNGGKILEANDITTYSKRAVDKITKGYSERIGGGNFGDVYMGSIDGDGTSSPQFVAVKCSVETRVQRCWQKTTIQHAVPKDEHQDNGFVNEIIFQFKITHPNVVKLLGCCLETHIPILVFELVSNGSLEDALHGANKRYTLSLLKRLDIAIGSAEALNHIHSHGDHVHGDMKPANILLDGDDLKPKVSDFGSSKLLSVNKYARAVAADRIYIDPVYILTDRFTVKSDVYSFGIVLLELITRKTAKYDEDKSLSLDFIRCFKDKGSGSAMYDREIFSGDEVQFQNDMKCLDRIGMLAIQCLKEDVEERPAMAKVVEELKNVRVVAYGGSSTSEAS